MTINYVSGAINPEDRKEIMISIATIRAKMPFIVELGSKTKRALPKMGDKSRAFVHKALEVANSHPDHLPRSFDLDEMRRDIELFDVIYTIAMELNQLQAQVDDTLVAVGSDAYSAALQVYRHVKAHGEGAGMDSLIDDLGQRFDRKSRKEASKSEAISTD
ncbi:MAG: hypothetical protein ACFE0I_24510 [Elainellaceae cyanobacterium]